jgi:hypothetical protein
MKHWVSNTYWWLKHRTWDRYHVVHIRSLEPGYHDVDVRMFHAAFDLLVDFVEGELAYEAYTGFSVEKPWWQTTKSYVKANAEMLANRHFDWVASDSDVGDAQRNSMAAVKELYVWYKHKRPKRANAKDLWALNNEPQARYQKRVDLTKSYEEEDTANLIRLVRIRGSLWT